MSIDKITLQMIRDRCDEIGDCWIWKNAVSQEGYPIMRVRPGGCILVRRVAIALSGRTPAARQPVTCTCDDRRCCNPKHLELATIASVAQTAAANGAFSSLARRAKIAAHKRASSGAKLTMDDARAIRASDETGPVLAAQYGVNKSLIGAIRRGTAWQEYSSPFAGLGALTYRTAEAA